MDTFEALYERRSIRDFDPSKKIPEDIVQKILMSAAYGITSPGGHPFWKIIVVRDREIKDMLAASAKEVAMLMFGASFELFGPGHLWYMPRDTQLAVAEYTTTGELWEYPRDADVNFVPVLSKGSWMDTVTSFSDDFAMLAQFLGFAAQNMWLTGYKYGVGAGYNGMPLLDTRRREVISESLGLPLSWDLTGAFSFGYSKEPRFFGPARPPLEGVVFSEYWGNPYLRIGLRESAYERMKLPKTEIEDTIKNLNLVKSFGDEPIPQWMIEKILDTAIWGPVPENFKNWRYLLIKDRESKEFLQKLVSEKKSSPWFFNYPELQHSRFHHLPPDERLEQIEKTFDTGFGKWYTEADTLILCLSTMSSWRDQPYEGFGAVPQPMLSISTGCCIQNMMLAATALGLGVNYDALPGGDQRTREMLLEYFGIPAVSWLPLGILGVGEAGEKVELPRLPLETMVYDEYWGNPYEFSEVVFK
jgi:nitroreductase